MIDWLRLGLRLRNLWVTPAAQVRVTRPIAATTDANATNEAVVVVRGLFCNLCARRVSRFLRAVPGVEAAACDLRSQAAIVRYDARRCAPADLERAVVRAAIAMPLRRVLARIAPRRTLARTSRDRKIVEHG